MSTIPDAYDTSTTAAADTLLPPLTASIRKVWRDSTAVSAATGPIADPLFTRAALNAIYALELRVIHLEGGHFP
ncbi:hypothetical protein [Nocardia sp. NPDC059239]|uniref:hypothetical protein n=1 Tax=Nocardia sp. NPDC059239 TaxID=3346785 RepID=UPI0036C36E84